jgi:C_GCAxxG_C_C family probable redox protein
MNSADDAVSLFRGDCNCAQAVLGAYAEELRVEPDMACRIACGFGGGMRRAETCGAVTGALMVIGLKHGPSRCGDKDGKDRAYRLAAEFQQRFASRHGSTICRDLLGCDISTEDGHRQAKEQEMFDRRCPAFVRDAAAILQELL